MQTKIKTITCMECANICASDSVEDFKEMIKDIENEGFRETIFLCGFIKSFLDEQKENGNLDFNNFIKIGVKDSNGKIKYY